MKVFALCILKNATITMNIPKKEKIPDISSEFDPAMTPKTTLLTKEIAKKNNTK